MKIAIVTDSNSGISRQEAEALGIFVLPMPFYIDGKDYYEELTLSREAFYEQLAGGAEISTSQPSPASVMELWDQVLSQYDCLLHIPMSSGLSGSCETAFMLSQEDKYEGRVFVVDNKKISIVLRQAVLDTLALIEKGCEAAEIKAMLEAAEDNNSIYIQLDTLKYLRKGGRITPVAAALGTLLKIKPVLTIMKGGKLDAFTKVRTNKQGRDAMLQAIEDDLRDKFHDRDYRNAIFALAHSMNEEQVEQLAQELKARFPEYRGELTVQQLSLSVACHIGPGAVAVAVYERMDALRV